VLAARPSQLDLTELGKQKILRFPEIPAYELVVLPLREVEDGIVVPFHLHPNDPFARSTRYEEEESQMLIVLLHPEDLWVRTVSLT